MSALKPKKFSSDEEEQEKIQYVVVSHKSQIKKILQAENEPRVIQKPQEQLPTTPNEQIGINKAKALKNRQFIKDDRHREYPKKEEQKRQTNFKEKYQPKQEEKKYKKSEREQQAYKEAPRRRNQRRQQKQDEQQPQKDEKKQNYQEGKKKFIEKPKSSTQKEDYFEAQRKNDKSISYIEKQKKDTIRQQYQFINGEQITVQLIQNKRQPDNVIFIGEKIAKDYVKIAKKLINQEDTIIIKAFGAFVSKAFLVAGLLADVTPGLKQINNPSTVGVFQFSKKSENKTRRGMIEIQLSLNNLNKKHFGYQQPQLLEPRQTQSSKPRDRPQQRRAYKQKQQVDERELR